MKSLSYLLICRLGRVGPLMIKFRLAHWKKIDIKGDCHCLWMFALRTLKYKPRVYPVFWLDDLRYKLFCVLDAQSFNSLWNKYWVFIPFNRDYKLVSILESPPYSNASKVSIRLLHPWNILGKSLWTHRYPRRRLLEPSWGGKLYPLIVDYLR